MLNNIQVVLCNTSHSGNIGAVARSMKTMGLTRLVLADPLVNIDDHSYALACNAHDVLSHATITTDIDAALGDSTLAYALTARNREFVNEVLDVKDSVPEILTSAHSGELVSLVFGSEKNGLTITQLEKCNRVITIPANPEYSSLNLAAAVQVVAYEIYSHAVAANSLELGDTRLALSSLNDVAGVFRHLEKLLISSGYYVNKNVERLNRRLQHIIHKANLTREDVDLLRGMLRYFEEV